QPARKAAPTSSTSVRAESCSSWSSRGTAPVNTAPRTGDESAGGLTDCRDASSDLGPRRHPRGHLPGRRPGAGPRDPGPAERCSAPRGGAAGPGRARPRRLGPGGTPRRARGAAARGVRVDQGAVEDGARPGDGRGPRGDRGRARGGRAEPRGPPSRARDRKSTRLNSSHVSISYAVVCLKKKTLAPEDRIAAAQEIAELAIRLELQVTQER